MLVHMYGTRGSCPVAGTQHACYGGNTTCVRVISKSIPRRHWLAIDAGTGFLPFGKDFLEAGARSLTLLQTHYHHDHTQGFALAAPPYIKSVPIRIWGPVDHGYGPEDVYRSIMMSPFFPVAYESIASHVVCRGIEYPNTSILLFHPEGGTQFLQLSAFDRLRDTGKQIPFVGRHRFDLAECLVITMYRSNHPEQTITYRFTENATGQSFVFLTDHESQRGFPVDFLRHISKADLLIQDCQYTAEKYETQTAGWGHGTPDYAAALAVKAGVGALGLTHHDPASPDELIREIERTATSHVREAGVNIPIFCCYDGQRINVGKVVSSS